MRPFFVLLLFAFCALIRVASAAASPGSECSICKLSPDLTPCGDHGACVKGVCWQWCGGGGYGSPACEAFPRGDDACAEDVCVYYSLPPCDLTSSS